MHFRSTFLKELNLFHNFPLISCPCASQWSYYSYFLKSKKSCEKVAYKPLTISQLSDTGIWLPLLLSRYLSYKISFLLFPTLTYPPSSFNFLLYLILLILLVPLILIYPYFPGSSPSSIPICFSKHLTFASLPFTLFPFSSSIAQFLPQQSPHLCLPHRHLLYSSTCFFPPSPLSSSSLTLCIPLRWFSTLSCLWQQVKHKGRGR